MLSLLYPNELPELLNFPIGLRLANIDGHERPLLIVKMPKEGILTAKLRKGFKVYVVPFRWEGKDAVGLASVFFDDPDEPLALYTPLFDDEASQSLRRGLLGGMLDVHLFDELDHELLGYASEIRMPSATNAVLAGLQLLPFSIGLARLMLDGMPTHMGLRDSADDAAAISIDFREALFPENLFLQDLRPSHNAFHGSPGFRYTTLIREEPGRLQELDIVGLLQRVFSPDEIYLGPLRVTDREEIADVIVATPTRLLLIQAKDSPNTEKIASNQLTRKMSTALKSLVKALAQVGGAVRYARSRPQLDMVVGKKEIHLPMQGREMYSLIVLKEMFSDQFGEYSPLLLQQAQASGIPCVAIDFPELNQYTAHLADEEAFFGALDRVFQYGKQHGTFPRLRFGLV